MCPVCITTVALIASGATSTGGLAAALVKLRGKAGAKKIDSTTEKKGKQNESANRIAS